MSTLQYSIYCYVKDGGIANKIFSLKKTNLPSFILKVHKSIFMLWSTACVPFWLRYCKTPLECFYLIKIIVFSKLGCIYLSYSKTRKIWLLAETWDRLLCIFSILQLKINVTMEYRQQYSQFQVKNNVTAEYRQQHSQFQFDVLSHSVWQCHLYSL